MSDRKVINIKRAKIDKNKPLLSMSKKERLVPSYAIC